MAKRQPISERRRVVAEKKDRPASKVFKNKQTFDYGHDDIDLNPEVDLSRFKETHEIVAMAKAGLCEVEAKIFGVKQGKAKLFHLNTKKFLEAYDRGNKKRTFRENIDSWGGGAGGFGNGIGDDYTPLLGGPFNKQLYFHDYLKMHATAFQASTHDPILKTATSLITDFTLGRGFRMDFGESKIHKAIWQAFEQANNLQTTMQHFDRELTIYGEQFVHWLPGNQIFNTYNVYPEQVSPTGMIPRIRLLDPSTVWEIVTYPEDISRKLYAQLVYPTQYQLYTGSDQGKPVQMSKFVYEQVPATDFDHYKINAVYNEKRGRSEFFAVLGYAKRLRDSVLYSILGLQKAAAWSIDTTVQGNQSDLDNYVTAQNELGPIPPPGSEFVHTNKITRQYLANEGGGRGGTSHAFDWCFSMVCAGLGIPQSYFATHLSGGNTKATAVVATEPITKKLENRQALLKQVLQDMAKRLFIQMNMPPSECEVTFPDLVIQDRSMKLKDLTLSEQNEWFSSETCANIAAKEMGIQNYDYKIEQDKIKAEKAAGEFVTVQNPLSSPGQMSGGGPGPGQTPSTQSSPGPSNTNQISGAMKTQIKKAGHV